MSENTQTKANDKKAKGLGRGLGSLLGPGGDGAFSKTVPNSIEDQTIEKLTGKFPSQQESAFKAPMVEMVSPAVSPAPVVATPPTPVVETSNAPVATPSVASSAAPATEPVVSPVAAATSAPEVKTEPVKTETPVSTATMAVEKVVATPAPTSGPQVPDKMRIWNLAIENVHANPYQPRQIFEKEPLQELADSIKEKGVIQPILVRRQEKGGFEIIAGERRWRASQLAGLKEIPAIIKDSDTKEVLELALIENIQRENLNAIEEAEAYEFLINKYNLTQADLALKVGKDRATVTNMLRILQLQPGVRQMVSNGELSLGQAKVLLSVSDAKLQQELADQAKSESLSVRALEKLIAKAKSPEKEEKASNDPRTKAAMALGEELQKLLGSKVVLDYEKGKGKIVIHFYSDQELNQVADTLRDSWRN